MMLDVILKKWVFIFPLFFSIWLVFNNQVEAKIQEGQILWGIVFTPEANGRSLESQIQDMKELGVNCAKFWLDWNWVEQRLAVFDSVSEKFGVDLRSKTDLSVDYLLLHPELIEEYAFPEIKGSRFNGMIDWSKTDRLIEELTKAGISALPLIGDAIATPNYPGSEQGEQIAPEPKGYRCRTDIAGQKRVREYVGIGRDEYLAHIYLFSAGLSRRYSKEPLRVFWWNTENELNWTYIHTSVAGWRCGKAWSDERFLTDLLRVLYMGIKAGNPEAHSTMNVNIHDLNWFSDLRNWSDYMDALGLGAYPNYLFPYPKLDWLLTLAVKRAKALTNRKPVFVLETGYPSGPEKLGWSEKLQSEYILESVRGAIRNGAKAYIYFKLDDTELDISSWNLQKVENHWGLVRLDGSRKPSFYAYKNAIEIYNNCNKF